MTDHKAALEHAQQYAESTQSGEHSNLCRAYLELAQRIKESQEQEPVAFVYDVGDDLHGPLYCAISLKESEGKIRLYRCPPIPPTQQEAIDKAVAEEREACAKVCEEKHINGNWKYDTREECADAIRKGE